MKIKTFKLITTFVHGGLFAMIAEYLCRVSFSWIAFAIMISILIDFIYDIKRNIDEE